MSQSRRSSRGIAELKRGAISFFCLDIDHPIRGAGRIRLLLCGGCCGDERPSRRNSQGPWAASTRARPSGSRRRENGVEQQSASSGLTLHHPRLMRVDDDFGQPFRSLHAAYQGPTPEIPHAYARETNKSVWQFVMCDKLPRVMSRPFASRASRPDRTATDRKHKDLDDEQGSSRR
jgi:hypothetical protein